MPASPWQQRYLDRYYRHRPGWVDGTTQFHALIAANLPPAAEVLELGPGPANNTSNFLASKYQAVDGLDVDPDAAMNPALRTCHLLTGTAWPLSDAGYDAVVANYVLEHVADPAAMAAEAFRVLRPGGTFIFRAPNLYHYVTGFSRLTPHWVHEKLANRLRKLPADAHDPYPTFYRVNTARTVRRVFARAGFQEKVLEPIEKDPSYGMANKLLFFAFMGYERVVNSTHLLGGFRSNLLGVFVKPAGRATA